MLKVKRFINELMTSNCYVVHEEGFDDCIVVDPASRYCLNEIFFFEEHKLKPSYIILTHEHTDHTWGVNTLIDRYNTKVICSMACKKNLPKETCAYFQLYYNMSNYEYHVKHVDITVEDINYQLYWNGLKIKFYNTPGHSNSDICFSLEDNLFTGDTIMQYKPFIDKKKGSYTIWKNSLRKMCSFFPYDTKVFPGHGVPSTLFEMFTFMKNSGIIKI